jgi:F-type H+-transporting ATPase subunit epsilon
MKLKIFLPTHITVDRDVEKVIADAENGSFCLLPQHVDFVAALVPGILSFQSKNGKEEFIAVDDGILVKKGEEVLVSTRNAIAGVELGSMKKMIEEKFYNLDEQEKKARSATARLEADIIRRFVELGKHEY